MKTVAFIFCDADNINSGSTRSLVDIIDTILEKHRDKIKVTLVFPSSNGSAISHFKNKIADIDILSVYYSGTIYQMRKNSIKKLKHLIKDACRYIFTKYNAYFKLRKELRARDIDIIFSNTSTLCIGAWLKKWEHYNHIWHFREFLEEDQGIRHLFGQRHFCKLASDYADIVNCISFALAGKYQSKIRTKINIIPDDISSSYISDAEKTEDAGNTILLIGTIFQGKGHDIAIDAINLLIKKGRNIKLIIAGIRTEPFYQECVDRAETYGIADFVDFVGFVEDVNNLRRSARFGIVASKSEAFGRVTIEGMLSHMLMIGNNTGACPELIQDKQNGLLFDKSPESLAEAIEFALDHPEKTDEMIENGYQYAKSFTVGRACDSILAEMDVQVASISRIPLLRRKGKHRRVYRKQDWLIFCERANLRPLDL